MSALGSGGPAVPLSVLEGGKDREMSLLDWFAGQALAGLLADHEYNEGPETAAKGAYSYAKAMMRQRSLPAEEPAQEPKKCD